MGKIIDLLIFFRTILTGNTFTIRGNTSVFIKEYNDSPWIPCDPNPTNRLPFTWGTTNATVGDILYTARQTYEPLSTPNINMTISVNGSIAEQIPHTTLYTEWIVSGTQYVGTDDTTAILAQQRRDHVMDFIGNRYCDVSHLITPSTTTVSASVTLYNQTSCLTILPGSNSPAPFYVVFDAQGDPNATFYVIIRDVIV